MDYYQHDMYSHLEKDSRRISQYNLLHKESSLDGKAGDRLSVSVKTAHCSQLIGFTHNRCFTGMLLIPIKHVIGHYSLL